MLTDVFEAIVKLGVPVALISWFGLVRLYRADALTLDDDRKIHRERLKKFRKERARGSGFAGLFENKWMQFGGGFYGSCALWTFVVIEAMDVVGLVAEPARFMALFEKIDWSLIGSLIANQIENLVSAFVWFSYWSDSGSFIGAWILVGYGAYLLGDRLARRTVTRGVPE